MLRRDFAGSALSACRAPTTISRDMELQKALKVACTMVTSSSHLALAIAFAFPKIRAPSRLLRPQILDEKSLVSAPVHDESTGKFWGTRTITNSARSMVAQANKAQVLSQCMTSCCTALETARSRTTQRRWCRNQSPTAVSVRHRSCQRLKHHAWHGSSSQGLGPASDG